MGETDRLHCPGKDSENNLKRKIPTDIQREMYLLFFEPVDEASTLVLSKY